VSPRGVIGSGSLRRLLDTTDVFRKAKESGQFFARRYGYAVLPTIGKSGIVVGGAHGTGRVQVKSQHARSTSMTQLTVGWQLGGQACSQIVFFEDKRAFDESSCGTF
jgi:lipid-binding SYLF domain-containing protein